MEKRKKNNLIVGGIFTLSIIFLMVFVFAATTINLPIAFGNYSGTFEINLTMDANIANNMTNVTCYSNSSGGAATTFLVEILNETSSNLNFSNSAIDISSLGDSLYYNISCDIYNGTTLNKTIALGNITFDSTPPNVSTFYNTVNDGSYKGLTVLNVSVVDSTIGIASVYFNITTFAGVQHNFTKASTSGAGYYNITLNTTKFTDGVYNITVYANDTQLNNLNNSESIQITIDHVNPAPSSLILSSATKTSLTITFSGADGTCTAAGSGTRVVSGSTLTVNGLTCANTYSYIITCIDGASNSGSSSSTSFLTSSCDSTGSTGSSSSSWTGGITYKLTDAQFKEGYSESMKVKERMKFKLGNIYHHIGVLEITDTKVTIEIASDPIEVKLEIGGETKVDLDEDGIYDLYLKLNTITNNKADITIKELSEIIPEGEGSINVEGGDVIGNDEDVPEVLDEERGNWWIAIIVILLIAAAAGGGTAWKKNQ